MACQLSQGKVPFSFKTKITIKTFQKKSVENVQTDQILYTNYMGHWVQRRSYAVQFCPVSLKKPPELTFQLIPSTLSSLDTQLLPLYLQQIKSREILALQKDDQCHFTLCGFVLFNHF